MKHYFYEPFKHRVLRKNLHNLSFKELRKMKVSENLKQNKNGLFTADVDFLHPIGDVPRGVEDTFFD